MGGAAMGGGGGGFRSGAVNAPLPRWGGGSRGAIGGGGSPGFDRGGGGVCGVGWWLSLDEGLCGVGFGGCRGGGFWPGVAVGVGVGSGLGFITATRITEIFLLLRQPVL